MPTNEQNTLPLKEMIYTELKLLFLIVTDGRKLGGCGDSIRCSDNQAPKCDQSEKSWEQDKIGLIGTCIPKSGYFSTVTFGSGKCRKGSVLCTTACDSY